MKWGSLPILQRVQKRNDKPVYRMLLQSQISTEGKKMSKETARKLIAELQTSEELRAKIEGITDPEALAKKAVEAGYDVTIERTTSGANPITIKANRIR